MAISIQASTSGSDLSINSFQRIGRASGSLVLFFVAALGLMAMVSSPVQAQCPAGYTSVPKNGFALGYETNSVNAPYAALGPLQVADNASGLFSPNNAPFLNQTNQFLTLNFGELITPGSPVTMSLGYYFDGTFGSTASKLKIETSSDGFNFTQLGFFGGPTATADYKTTNASQVADHITFNAPAGGILKMRFTFVAGQPYVEGVRYTSVCRPTASLTCSPLPQPAVSVSSTGTSAVVNANGALTLDYLRFTESTSVGINLSNISPSTDTKLAGLNGNGRGVLVADLGKVVTTGNYILINMGGWMGSVTGIPSGVKGRRVQVTVSTDGTTYTAISGGSMGNYLNATDAQNYFDFPQIIPYFLPIPAAGVRYVKITDLGSDGGKDNFIDKLNDPDLFVDFVGYSCTPSLYDFGDLPDASASNSATDFSSNLASNGPRHEKTYRGFTFQKIEAADIDKGSYYDQCSTSAPCSNEYNQIFSGSRWDLYLNASSFWESASATEGNEEGLDVGVISPTATSYSISAAKLTGSNTTSFTANIYAWLDKNRNGTFEASEAVTTTFANGASTADGALSWSGLSGLTNGMELALRVRITTIALTDDAATTAVDERSLGLAPDGEVEDYLIQVRSVSAACFPCINSGFAVGGSPSSFYKVDLRTGVRTLVKANITGGKYTITALGFNEATAEFWGVAQDYVAPSTYTMKLVKITTATGAVTYEDLPNLPYLNYEAGEIANGKFYLYSPNYVKVYVNNTDPNNATNFWRDPDRNGNDNTLKANTSYTYYDNSTPNNRTWIYNPSTSRYVLGGPIENLLYILDVSTKAVTTVSMKAPYGDFVPYSEAPMLDLAMNPVDGNLYYASSGETNLGWRNAFHRINPATGDVKILGKFINKDNPTKHVWSQHYFDNIGRFYAISGGTYKTGTYNTDTQQIETAGAGQIYRQDNAATLAEGGAKALLLISPEVNNQVVFQGDGARCTSAPLTDQFIYAVEDFKFDVTIDKPVLKIEPVPGGATTTSIKMKGTLATTVPGGTILEQGFYYFDTDIMPDIAEYPWKMTSQIPCRENPNSIKLQATTSRTSTKYVFLPGNEFEAELTGLTPGKNYAFTGYTIVGDANGNTWYFTSSYLTQNPFPLDNPDEYGRAALKWGEGSTFLQKISTIAKEYAERYTVQVNGNATMIGNSLVYDAPILQYADIDEDPTTQNSSSADIILPQGSKVLKAYLVWMARTWKHHYPNQTLSGTEQVFYEPYEGPDDRFKSTPPPADPTVARALLKGPGGTYQSVVPLAEDLNSLFDGTRNYWRGIADVTSIVKQGGFTRLTTDGSTKGSGTYTVSVPFLDQAPPEVAGRSVSMAGWSMIIVYQTALEPPRQIKVYDGFFNIVPGVTYSTSIDNLITPTTSDYRSTFGIVSLYGDPGRLPISGLSGDYIKVGTDKSSPVAISDAENPADDPFNSTISIYRSDFEDLAKKGIKKGLTVPRNPASGFTHAYSEPGGRKVYTANGLFVDDSQLNNFLMPTSYTEVLSTYKLPPLFDQEFSESNLLYRGKSKSVGFDVDVIKLNDYLEPGITSVNFEFGTQGDFYMSGAAFLAVELKSPKITGTKGLVDLNGGQVEVNDILEYRVAIQNTGSDDGINTSVIDSLPTSVNLIPNSIRLTKGFGAPANEVTWENGVQMTDDIDDDRAYYTAESSFEVTLYGETEIRKFTPGTTQNFDGIGTLLLNADGSSVFTPDPAYSGEPPKVNYIPGNAIVWFVGDDSNPSFAYRMQRDSLDGYQILTYRVIVNSTAFGQPVINTFTTNTTGATLGFDTSTGGISDVIPTPTDINLDGEFTLPIYPDVNATYVGAPLQGSVSTNEGLDLIYKTPTADPTNPAGADLKLNPDGTYTFNATTPGIYYYDVPACPTPTATNCPINKLAITVTDPYSPQDQPLANTDIASTRKDVPVTLKTLSNDQDTFLGTPLNPASVKVLTPADSIPGTVSVDPATGNITFTPDPGFTGYAIYEYEVCDSSTPTPLCTKARQEIQVLGDLSPNATSASDDYSSGYQGAPQTGNLLTNDHDPEGNTQSVTAQNLTLPEGSLVINADGSYTFTPVADFKGPLNVPYTVCDNQNPAACTEATLYLLVVDPVNPKDDVESTPANTSFNGSVKTNDQVFPGTTYGTPDPDPNNPAGATLTFNPDGTYTFTAPTFGVYVYTIPVCGQGQTTNCDTETLTINVLDVKDDLNSGLTNVPVTGDIAPNDITPQGTTYGTPVPATTNPGEASITINPDGTYSFVAPVAGVYEFEVPVCQPGQSTNCETQLLTITIIGTNPDVNATFTGVPVKGDVLTNDDVPAGTTFGTPVADATNPGPSTITMNPDGTYEFTAAAPGVYLFDVPVCPEGQTENCPTEKLRITVLDPAADNNVPVANTDLAVTPVDTPVTIATLANDLPGGADALDPASVAVPVQPANGSVTVDPVTGNITYTPNAGFTGVDVYTYTVCDTATPANCTTATQEVTILPADAPNTTFASDDYNYTNSLVPATGSVLTNDPDAEGDNRTVTAQDLTLPEGTFKLNADGTYVFTPAAGFSGPVNIDYQVCDDGTPKACANATLYLLVAPANADPDVNATFTNVPVDGSVETNDEMPAGTTYGTPVLDDSPAGSAPQITMNQDGTYTFTGDKPGVYVYDVPVCPEGVTTNCPTEKLTITVTNPNGVNPPIANTDLASTEIGKPVTLNTLANDQSGTPGKSLNPASVEVTAQPANGTVSVNPATGAITYTPAAGFTGIDFYTYKVCDTNTPAQCTTAIQEIIVSGPNSPNTTTAADDYNSTYGQVPAKGNLLSNDNDAQGDKQTATPQDITLPEGAFKLNADGTYTFTPAAGFVGPVNIPYTICDDGTPVACSSATLYILVSPGDSDPDINATFTNVPVQGDVSTNDGLPVDASYGTPAPVSKPSGAVATITLNPDGTYEFTADKPGVYVYDVPVCTGGQTSECPTERLVINVLDKTGTPNAPVANIDIAYTAPATPVTLNTLANDGAGLGKTLDPASVAVTVQPANGTVSVDPVTGNITYTPNANFTGVDVYTYTVCDDATPAQCTTAIQEVTVAPATPGINQTQAADDYALGTGDEVVSGNVSGNDTDSEGDAQSVTPQTLDLPEGKFTLNADGSYTFDPVAGFSGPLNIPYTTCDDGTPVACANATLYILITPFDPQPDVNATFVDKPISGSVATNDQVFEGAQYSVESANPSNPTGGQLTLNPDGTYDFTSPNPGIYKYNCYVCAAITPTGQVPPCEIVLLTITVLDPLSVTEGPIANTDIAVTEEGTPVVLKTLVNDAPGSITTALVPSSVAIATQPANGTVSVNPATGDITYTPNAGFTGIDEYTYTVCDNQTPAKCATAVQKVTVNAPDLANSTLAADDFAATIGSSPVSGSVLTNDTDPEGNSRTVVPQTVTTAEGTLTLNADGTYTFTAVPGFSGPLEYPYEVCDNGTPQACASATLYILVRLAAIDAVNDDYSTTPVNGYTGGSPGNIFTNDQVNNLPLVANDVTVSVVNNGGLTGVTIASNGTITVPAGTPAGTYNVTYKICQKLVPTLCDEAVVTIVVNPPAILATTDDLTATPISNERGGVAGNIFPNDQLNNTTIDGEIKSDVTITLLNEGGLTGVTIADDGTVTVPPGTEPGTYTLRYKICDNLNPTNCSEADVIILIEQTVLVIPDGLSPNGDGLNDVFFIEGLTAYPDNEILIFNRWGNKVFEAKPYLNNWDGTSSSNLTVGSANRLPPGTYFYVLKLTEKKHVTGYIYIAY